MKWAEATIATAILLGTAAVWAGPIVIDGTDANDHGQVLDSGNEEGWLYMQRVLENLAAEVDPSVAKVVVDLGTTEIGSGGFGARAAINSAFALSSLPGNGWTLIHVDGTAAIDAWLASLTTSTTGILYIPSAGQSSGDLGDDELVVINSHSLEIGDYVDGNGNPNTGGALFAMGESPGSGVTPFGWLINLLPDTTVVDVGAGGIATDLSLTFEGGSAFPGLSSSDLSSGPWHNFFIGDYGGLNVLATALDNQSIERDVILGGGAGTSFGAAHSFCITRSARYWATHLNSDNEIAPPY